LPKVISNSNTLTPDEPPSRLFTFYQRDVHQPLMRVGGFPSAVVRAKATAVAGPASKGCPALGRNLDFHCWSTRVPVVKARPQPPPGGTLRHRHSQLSPVPASKATRPITVEVAALSATVPNGSMVFASRIPAKAVGAIHMPTRSGPGPLGRGERHLPFGWLNRHGFHFLSFVELLLVESCGVALCVTFSSLALWQVPPPIA
jgi:hypothetical protein